MRYAGRDTCKQLFALESLTMSEPCRFLVLEMQGQASGPLSMNLWRCGTTNIYSGFYSTLPGQKFSAAGDFFNARRRCFVGGATWLFS